MELFVALHLIILALFYIVINLPFSVNNDHLTYWHHRTCQPFLPAYDVQSKQTQSICLRVSFLGDQRHKQVQQMTKGAKCFLGIRWAYILHSGPNLPNSNTRISLEDPLPLFLVKEHLEVERGPHHVKLNDFEEFQSEHLSVTKRQTLLKNKQKKQKHGQLRRGYIREGNRKDGTNYGTMAELLLDSS